MCNTKLYHVYRSMKARCNNPNVDAYDNYGGRGIKVCSEWEDNFNNFKDWALKNGYSEELTLDRKNNNGGYNPDNCRFVTMKKQQNNRRDNIKIKYKGKKYPVKDISKISDYAERTIYKKYKEGLRGEDLLFKEDGNK